MKKLIDFYRDFKSRSGIHILNATIISRLLSFFASWVALQFIPNIQLGYTIYAMNIIALIMPISGFGGYQGLLRFGSLLESKHKKNQLYLYVLKKGSIFSVLLIMATIILSSVLTYYLPNSQFYLIALSFSIFTLFLLESIKVQFRVLNQNKLFAKTEITYNVVLFLLVFLGSYFYQEKGYIIALVMAPLISFFIFFSRAGINSDLSVNFIKPNISFWKYSIFAGLSNVATQILIVLDILLIGILLKDPELVTMYKYLSLIPFSLLFLPRVVLTTDFVSLTKNHLDKVFMRKYVKNYLVSFSIISFIIIALLFIFTDLVLSVFGDDFTAYRNVFRILLFGISFVLILRGLYGNLLSTIGKASANYWISFTGIILNLISNFYLIPKYGLMGAALTSAIIMGVTSILSVILYYYHLKKIRNT